MLDSSIIELANSLMLLVAVIGGMYFVSLWRRDKKQESSLTLEERMLKFREPEGASRVQEKINLSNSGGYITIEMPEDHKSLFHDFLKGFEDYASIRGYKVSFSSDATERGVFSFKFTVSESGVSVSTSKVRDDFNEYLRKVESGESLDNLPIVTTKKEHDLLLTKLKNRVSFLQHNYNLSKNTIEYYEKLLKSVSFSAGFTSPPPVIVQTGGTLDAKSYNANNSNNVLQGEGSSLNVISNDNSIRIANSFNERKSQIDELSKLIKLLQNESSDISSRKASVELEKVKGELEDEDTPDNNRIEKWLKKATTYLNTVKKSKELLDKANEVYTSFNIPEMLNSLGSSAA